MLEQIFKFITDHDLISNNKIIIVGLSGGPDSVFLLHVLAQIRERYKLTLIAAHLDHQWRPDSYKDVDFCKQIAQELDAQFVCAQASEFITDIKDNGSQEEVGRNMRRAFLESVAKKYHAGAIALGHHLQDQEETFFIRLIRGTTLTGLIGIRPKHGLYIRPLLETNKKNILTYLHTHNIAYLTDPTNLHESYLRNRIRLNVLPALAEADNRFDSNFVRTHHALVEAEHFLENYTQQLYIQLTHQDALKLEPLLEQKPYIQKRLLIMWLIKNGVPFTPTDSFLDEIIRFFKNKISTQHAMHEIWSLVKNKGLISIQTRK